MSRRFQGLGLPKVGMTSDADQLRANLVGRENEVHATGCDGVAGHVSIFRRLALREGNPALRFDGFHAHRAVRRRSGENYPGFVPPFFRQRAQEEVDGQMVLRRRARHRVQAPLQNSHIHIRRNHVDAIGLYRHAVFDLRHGDLGRPAQQFRQGAFVLGGKVLHQHKGHPGLSRQVPKQLRESLPTARGSPNANDRKGFTSRAVRTWNRF